MLRFVVLSDLHAHQKEIDDASAPSQLSSLPRNQGKAINPIAAFPQPLSEIDFEPQLVVCPGDLGDKNDASSQQYAWSSLDALKKRLRANRLIGVVGNHDLDSRRGDTSLLPQSNLRSLIPNFPLSSKEKSNKYWADGYVFYEYGECCILLINSCSFHGMITGGSTDEHNHGKISRDTIQRIRSSIRQRCKSINIMVVHHHIRQHPWLPNENSHIQNGPELLDVLTESGYQWLVLHGHAHMPHLGYATTDALSPIIFSAGSVSARLWDVPNKLPRNQAYAIEVAGTSGHELRGRVQSWDWAPYVGWTRSAVTSGLPFECGFGLRPQLSTILTSLIAAFEKHGTQYLEWDIVKKEVGELSYLVPDDRHAAFEVMRSNGVTVHFDVGGNPTVFSRST